MISDINPLTNQTSTKILPFKHHCRWLNRVEATSLMLKASFLMVQPRSATAGSISFLKSLRDVPHHEPLAVACARLLPSDAVSTCFQPSGNGMGHPCYAKLVYNKRNRRAQGGHTNRATWMRISARKL